MNLFVVVGIGFALLGPLFVVVGLRNRRVNRSFERTAQRVPGVVTELHTRSRSINDEISILQFPVLRFTTLDGASIETESITGSRPAPAKVGDAVTVLYDPSQPTVARIETAIDTGALLSGCFVAFGICFSVLGAIIAAIAWWAGHR